MFVLSCAGKGHDIGRSLPPPPTEGVVYQMSERLVGPEVNSELKQDKGPIT
jgi:hypothetical protein